MKFKYFSYPTRDPNRPWKRLPLIPIKIINNSNNKSIQVYALIDSGADKSLSTSEIAEILEIDLTKGKEETFSGIEGGMLTAYVINIDIQIIGDSRIIKIPIGFIPKWKYPYIILGQEGFFDYFKIIFDRKKFEIELK